MIGLASPHPFLSATPLAVEASAVFSLVQFVVGDMEWFGFFRLPGGERGVWECRLLSGLPSSSEASGAGAHRAPVMDVPVILQLQAPAVLRERGGASDSVLDRVLQIPVVLQRRVRAVQTVAPVQFLEVVDAPIVLATTGAVVGPESVEILRDFAGAVLDKVVGMPLVCRYCGCSAVTVHRHVWFTCLLLCSDWCRWSRQCS